MSRAADRVALFRKNRPKECGGTSKFRITMFWATLIGPTQVFLSGSSGRQLTLCLRISARVAP